MECKSGTFSARTGRTVRSRFVENRGKRPEGLLMRFTVRNSSRDENEDEGEQVTYSLGKQNRWLLPEVIKTNSVEFEGEVILVEQYTSEGNRKHRTGSLSFFNSKENNSMNNTKQKPKRKRTRSKKFSREGEESDMKTRYEVTYPNPAGSWSKSTKRPAAHLGKRKKNSCSSWMLEDDFDYQSGIEFSESEDEGDFGEQFDRTSSLELNFHLLVDQSPHTVTGLNALNSLKSGISTQLEDNESALAGRCIYIESDDEMHETHVEFLSKISSGCSLLDVKNQVKNNESSKPEVKKRRRRQGTRNRDNEEPEKLVPPVDTSSLPVELAPSDRDDGVLIILSKQEVSPATLTKQWGQMYKEGACYPRTFLLNVSHLLPIPNSKEAFIVFRIFDQYCDNDSSDVKALVALVVCDDDTNTERIPKEFASHIQSKSAHQETRNLKDIVDITALCFHSELTDCAKVKINYRKPRQPRLSLGIFSDLFGWKSKTYSSQAAQQEIKESVIKAKEVKATSTVVASGVHGQPIECEICFKEMQHKGFDVGSCFMSLNACGHKFCDDCWRAHMRTQIQLGHTELRCPEYQCTALVDDVAVMSLLPSWYPRHLTKKLEASLEVDPEWKWCPADQCKLVVKATTPENATAVCDEHVTSVHPVPVVCVCGNMWCFKCQEDAHWPATCEEARTFREENITYSRLVTSVTKKKNLITSVRVKHCPFCNYPVEKGEGCDHMRCAMCFKEFCWACLGKWTDYSHHCTRKLVSLRKVNLPINHLVQVVSYEHIAITSRVARTSFRICKIHRKLNKIQKELNIYAKCFPLKPGTSCAEKRVNLLCENNAVCELKEVFNFKFQALLVLEGAAMRLAFSKATPSCKKLAREFSRLFFIVERMDEILKDLNNCLRDKDCLFKLKHFVKFGKKCILFIGRNTKHSTVTN